MVTARSSSSGTRDNNNEIKTISVLIDVGGLSLQAGRHWNEICSSEFKAEGGTG